MRRRSVDTSLVKVAHVTTIDLSLRYLLLNQMLALKADGFDVVGISAPGPDVPTLEAAGIRHIAVPMTRRFTPLADLRSLISLYRVMRREAFTIVHTHNPKPGLLGQIAARAAGVPIVVNTVHGLYFHAGMNRLAWLFYATLERIAARCSDVILSQSREDVETLVSGGIAGSKPVVHLGNGIDIRRFDRARVSSAELDARRREFDLRDGAPVVGFVGRLVAEKGMYDLIEAARLVLEQVPDAQFLIVGPADPSKRDAVPSDLATREGVGRAFRFVGLRTDMPVMFALMDVFVLPSHREGVPRSPMEAASMAIPAVVTDVRGCREVVEEGRTGLVVPPRAPEALAAAIVRILKDPVLAAGLGQAARELAVRRFDEQNIFGRVRAVYRRLLEPERDVDSEGGAEPPRSRSESVE